MGNAVAKAAGGKVGVHMSDETMGSSNLDSGNGAGLTDFMLDKAEQRTLLIAAGVMTGALIASIGGFVLIIAQSVL